MSESLEHWLSLDLSSVCAGLAIHARRGLALTLLVENNVGIDSNPSEKFLGALDEGLGRAGISLNDISRFITTSGPGSFTGLRIAYASLKAFAFSTGKPIETVNSSEARLAFRGGLAVGARGAVITTVARDRYTKSEWKMAERLELVTETVVSENGLAVSPGTLILRDERTPALPQSELFPLQAKHLGQCLLIASSRKTYASLPEWITASPQYFGDRLG